MARVPALSSCGDRHGGRCATRCPSASQGRPALVPAACRREPVSAQTTGLVHRTPSEAPARHHATRLTLVILTRFIDWRPLLTIVQPDTLGRWHRDAFRLFWRWQISPSRATAHSSGPAAADRGDGESKPDMGRGAHCRRAVAQARHLALGANGQTLHAPPALAAPRVKDPGVAHVPAQPCPRRPRV
jgi:hypothetical protein